MKEVQEKTDHLMSMSNKKELELQNCRRKLNEAERLGSNKYLELIIILFLSLKFLTIPEDVFKRPSLLQISAK